MSACCLACLIRYLNPVLQSSLLVSMLVAASYLFCLFCGAQFKIMRRTIVFVVSSRVWFGFFVEHDVTRRKAINWFAGFNILYSKCLRQFCWQANLIVCYSLKENISFIYSNTILLLCIFRSKNNAIYIDQNALPKYNFLNKPIRCLNT